MLKSTCQWATLLNILTCRIQTLSIISIIKLLILTQVGYSWANICGNLIWCHLEGFPLKM